MMIVGVKFGIVCVAVLVGLGQCHPKLPDDDVPLTHEELAEATDVLGRYDPRRELVEQPRDISPSGRLDLYDLLNELEKEEVAIVNELNGQRAAPAEIELPVGYGGRAMDKRRSRYGFWATAINKMGDRNLRRFFGTHRNIYNMQKRRAAPSRGY